MSHPSTTPLLLIACLILALAGSAWARNAQDAPSQLEATPTNTTNWEYKVVGLLEIHGNTLNYLEGILDNAERSLKGLAEATEAQLTAKTEDLLNQLGKDGWELEHYDPKRSMIFKRPRR